MERLSRHDIVRALDAVARRLAALREHHDLLVVGGAALVLLYDARPSTRDVDAISIDSPGSRIREVARDVARSLGLPDDWLNDGAKGYLHGVSQGDVVFDAPGLTVRTAGLPQMLAMKLCAWRDDVDIEDARLLLSKLSRDRATT